MEIFDNLNDKQIEAIKNTEGAFRIIAGAGSGKTKTLTSRFIYLVKKLGIPTNKILSVTFTNKAANEMKKRIRGIIGDFDTAYISTFHGFCNTILREDIHIFSYPSNFTIIDTLDQKTILKEVFEELGLSSKEYSYKKILDRIGIFKLNISYVKLLEGADFTKLNELIEKEPIPERKIFYKYLYKQRKNYCLDFDDLLMFVLHIFKKDINILEKWQNKLEYIQVDEFQDVSEHQYTLVKMLSEKNKNLFIVGDPDQNIYSWRGARIDFILNFDKDFKDAKTTILDQNYRSTKEILEATNKLISCNTARIKKDLFPTVKRENSKKPFYFHAQTLFEETSLIANEIKKLLDNGINPEEIAILYRANFLSRSIEQSLTKKKIPYVLYNGTEFYSRKEIKDILSYLKLINNDNDNISFLRAINEPARGIGKKRLEAIQEYSEKNNLSHYQSLIKNLDNSLIKNSKAKEFIETIEFGKKLIEKKEKISDILDKILKISKLEEVFMNEADQERLDNLNELKNSIYIYETDANEEVFLSDYLNEIALFTDRDRKNSKGCIKLMTIHTSKGLEFDNVVVMGLNEGIFPSARTTSYSAMEEERRLAYVAFTRAKESLILTESEGYNYDNSFKYPSRFILNIDKQLLDYQQELPSDLIEITEKFIKSNESFLKNENNIFFAGDSVEHETFGEGIILEINNEDCVYKIQFKEKIKTIQFGFLN